ncbi:MAG TPA: tripartite tricarboxylate transporter substrate binding protein [Burkholderiales bacterium]|nr:tripartite tricarboxylate transporter substrate binding protein [Burkholderiales bacterium]
MSFAVRLITGALLFAAAASAQQYPTKPIRVITTVTGGGNDLVARLVQPKLTERLGEQIVIDNRGSIGPEIVAREKPDGYTLLIAGGNLWALQFLRKSVAWDAEKDFAPITLAVTLPNLVVVHPALPVKSVKELLALAKARPGELNYSSGTTGVSTHLAAELFKVMAHVQIVRVPYKGGGPAMNAVIAGESQVSFPNAGSAAPHVKSGRVRALAVSTAQPSALFPDLPTVASAGIPGYEWLSMIGFFAPAGTPPALVRLLNKEIVQALRREDVKGRLFTSGIEVLGNTPEEFAAVIKADIVRTARVIRDAGITGE